MKSEHIQKITVVSPFYPPHVGGLQTHADEFNRHLADRGYHITVLTSQIPRSAPQTEFTSDRRSTFRFPVWEIIGNYPLPAVWSPHFWQLWREVQTHTPDLIISRTRFFISSLLAVWLARHFQIPLLHIEHGSDFVQLSTPLLRHLAHLYDLTLGKTVLRQATTVVANSEATKKFVEKLTGRRDITVIYRGIDKEALRRVPADTALRSRYPTTMLVTYIGRIIDGKGIPTLLHALAAAPDSNIHCSIIGDGPAWPAMDRLVRHLRIGHLVTFFRNQAWPQAMAYLKGSDVYINPSYAEGLPTGVIEAALCERCIIATNVGGTPEIISHNKSGLLFTAGDVAGLTAALLQVQDPSIRQTLGHQAALAVTDRFNWSASIQQYDTLVRSLRR